MKERKKILIIEDNGDIARAMSEVLSDMGFEVHEAPDGKTALDRLFSGDIPALIILDFFLPIMSGIEFRRRQLLIPHLARIPVVAMSADCFAGRKLARLGIRHCLKKPFELQELVAAIEEVS